MWHAKFCWGKPDIIIQVADAKNMRRTLLITSQLAEFGIPMVLVLDMIDEAEERGIEIDLAAFPISFPFPLSRLLQFLYSRGRRQLLNAIQNPADPPDNPLTESMKCQPNPV